MAAVILFSINCTRYLLVSLRIPRQNLEIIESHTNTQFGQIKFQRADFIIPVLRFVFLHVDHLTHIMGPTAARKVRISTRYLHGLLGPTFARGYADQLDLRKLGV